MNVAVKFDPRNILSEPARSKFAALADLAADRLAAVRASSEAMEFARSSLNEARVNLLLYEKLLVGRTVEHEARLRVAIEQAEIELRHRAENRDTRTARSQAIGGLVRNLENYLGGLPITSKLTPFTGTLPKRKGSPSEAIAAARAQIAKLQDRIGDIERAPRPSDEAIARAIVEIDNLAALGAPDVDGLIAGASRIEWPVEPLQVLAQGSSGPVVVTGDVIAVMPTLAWLFHDQLIKATTASFREAADDAHAIAFSARPQMLRALRDELLEAERIEEISASEIGVEFDRRADADPRAVLGLASTLPAPRSDW